MRAETRWILACALLAGGEACGFAAAAFAGLWPVALTLLIAVLLIGFGRAWRQWPAAAVFLAGLLLALLTVSARLRALDTILIRHGGAPYPATFVIGDDLREETSAKGVRRYVFTGAVDGIPVRVSLAAALCDAPPHPGETWRCAGWLGRSGDGLFGRRRPFRVTGRAASARRLSVGPSPLATTVRTTRAALARRLAIGLDPRDEAVALNRAMLLGERHLIPRSTREAFVAAGTIHIFAISGLHVLFVARFVVALLRLAGVSTRFAGVCSLPLLWAYVILTGCGPSAIRAATMASLYFTAPVFWRRPNGFTAWAIAFLITYARDPAMLFDVGCGFSFAVMLALVVWSHAMRGFRFPRPIALAAVSVIAWAAGVPLAAHVFGRITFGGLIANLAAVHLAAVSVVSAMIGLAVSPLGDGLAAFCNNLSALSTTVLAGLSRLIGSQAWSSCDVEPWSYGSCCAWYAAFAVVLVLLRRHLRNREERL